jgi:hypothetical protein
MPDIDIDVADRDAALVGLQHVPAVLLLQTGGRQRHATGVYLTDIPTDPIDGMASIPYAEAEALGYFKFDVLNNSIYRAVRNEAHLDALMADPPWEFLDAPEIASRLAHIGGHLGVVKFIRPRSVEDLAVCLALIRPGKRHLMGKSREQIDAEIWQPGADGYSFKRSHAVAYAMSIVVQLNLLVEAAAQELETDDAPLPA